MQGKEPLTAKFAEKGRQGRKETKNQETTPDFSGLT
jgi:hypothetical protein